MQKATQLSFPCVSVRHRDVHWKSKTPYPHIKLNDDLDYLLVELAHCSERAPYTSLKLKASIERADGGVV